MRILTMAVMSAAAVGSGAIASPPAASRAAVTAGLLTALRSAVVPPGQGTPPGQMKRPVDPDQGDDNASIVAIMHVCNHDNPSATRSAICPSPISPE